MSTGADKLVGAVAFGAAWVIFIYYTLWAIVMPFVDEDNALQQYFPAFEYAISLPFFVLVVGLVGIVAFFTYASAKQKAKQAKKAT
ncbi:hypothetical protein [Absidia glauca]|uniref:Dolichol phosphate-mannose biosynthesis regulatory protein n=1 Tax=Absidia glauca TaxID=4829 RepID=A0A168P6J2_ABSGL|nr:hypothetical protein [Absidia glauca]